MEIRPELVTPNKITGIVLAGGKSSRMGTDKGLLDFRGKMLVQYSLDLLSGYCHELFISTNNPDYSILGIPMIKDTLGGKGPVAGLITALGISTGDWILVVGCDMPFLQPALIDLLISSAGDYTCVVPVHQGLLEPTAALYHPSMGDLFREAVSQENFSLRKIILDSRACLLPVDHLLIEHPLMFCNVNTPEDFRVLTG